MVSRQSNKKPNIHQNGREISRKSKRVRRSHAATPPPRADLLKSVSSSDWPPLIGTFPRALRETFSDLDRTLRSGALIGGAMHSLSRENIVLAGRALQKHIDASVKLVNSRTPEEFLLAQHDLLRTTVAEFTSSVHRMTEVISKLLSNSQP
jgi:hypothetical protein